MTAFQKTFSTEIARIAKKELRVELLALKKASSDQRSEISALKKQIRSMTQEMRHLVRALPKKKAVPVADLETTDGRKLRFSGAGLTAARKRLGLTFAQAGLLLDASALTLSRWENESAHPRRKNLARIKVFIKMTKREAKAALAALA